MLSARGQAVEGGEPNKTLPSPVVLLQTETEAQLAHLPKDPGTRPRVGPLLREHAPTREDRQGSASRDRSRGRQPWLLEQGLL